MTSSPSAARLATCQSPKKPTATSQQQSPSRSQYVRPLSHIGLYSSSHVSACEWLTLLSQTAAKTALLLDNTQLKESIVQVSSAASLEELSADKSGQPSGSSEEISQEDKPRARILAEYLAHGYTVSDKAVERAIALDSKLQLQKYLLQQD